MRIRRADKKGRKRNAYKFFSEEPEGNTLHGKKR